MPFTHTPREPGEMIRSVDWNAFGLEIVRLGDAKVNREGDSISGALTVGGTLDVTGDATIGTRQKGATLQLLKRQEAGSEAEDGALVVGSRDTGTNLRLGYNRDYAWAQAQGGNRSLSLNPGGGHVGIGVAAPAAPLHVNGAARVDGGLSLSGELAFGERVRQMIHLWKQQYGIGVQGWTQYYRSDRNFAWYTGGSHHDAELNPGGGAVRMALRDGNLGVGTVDPKARLHVAGDAVHDGSVAIGANADVTGTLGFGSRMRQIINLYDTRYGIGVSSATFYFRTGNHFCWYHVGQHTDTGLDAGTGGSVLMTLRKEGNLGIGTTNPAAKLHVAGGDLRLDAGREIVFADNGQIRSADDNHRLLFRRSENKMELREYGSIVFSPGATAGKETAKVTIESNGNLSIPTAELSFGSTMRQMINLWSTTYGIGVQDSTLYLRTAGSVAVHVGGSHRNAALDPGGGVRMMRLDHFSCDFNVGDFNIGHRDRRGKPGRALVDLTNTLCLNYDKDWKDGVRYYGSLSQTSTREIKRNIEPLELHEARSILNGLSPVSFEFRQDEPGEQRQLGFIAEEVPDIIATTDHQAVSSDRIVAVLTRVVKEQERLLRELVTRIQEPS